MVYSNITLLRDDVSMSHDDIEGNIYDRDAGHKAPSTDAANSDEKDNKIQEVLKQAEIAQKKSEEILQEIKKTHTHAESDLYNEDNSAKGIEETDTLKTSNNTHTQNPEDAAYEAVKELREQEVMAVEAAGILRKKAKEAEEKISSVQDKVNTTEKELSQELQKDKGSALKLGGYKVSDLAMTLIKPPEPSEDYEPPPDPKTKTEYRRIKKTKDEIDQIKNEVIDSKKQAESFEDSEKKRMNTLDKLTN
jgi:predicted house-cleaning NTP pyrophosphatase (Maf/HAM1 superfamily)